MQTITLYNSYLSRIAVVLALCSALAVFFYAIFLLMAVTHTTGRSVAQRDIQTLSAHLGDMEMEYLTEQKSLTQERAQSLGYVKPVLVSTVYASPSAPVLTLNSIR